MHVFLYEFFSGGGVWSLEQPVGPVASLLREGAAMTAALAEDLLRVPGVRVIILRDTRLSKWSPPGCQVRNIADAVAELRQFTRLAAQSDWTIVIAPELEGALLTRCRQAEAAGGRLLGPGSETVALASDKQRTAAFLAKAGIPTPPRLPWPAEEPSPGGLAFPAVLKPRMGAGSLGVRLIQNAGELPSSLDGNAWRLERWCSGRAASVSWIAGGSAMMLLEPCFQRISEDGQFRYLGGAAPLPEPLRARARELAERVANCLPPTRGYLGMDVVLSDDKPDGDVVIEINPRLTTSYLGLRKIAQVNLAEAMLAAAEGRDFELRFSREPVEFGSGDEMQFGKRGQDSFLD
ncbi:MAG: ATP-grasp domain-containing protein [Pirellulaceae bacterium]